MSMPKWHEIATMTDADLAARFDAVAESTSPGVAFWGDVLTSRAILHAAQVQLDQAEDTKALNLQLVELTDELATLTKRILLLTVVAAAAALVSAVIQLVAP